jgi:transcriptional regulator with PAS, ATPase and Fis domain
MNDRPSVGRKITLTETSDLLAPALGAEAPTGTRFALMVFCDAEAQLRLLEEGSSVVIGREPPAEIVVNDASVSRQHARILRKQDEVWVEDLDSRNGTVVRGNRVQRQRLESGDQVEVGRVRVVLAATRPPAASAEEDSNDTELVIVCARMRAIHQDAARATRGKLPVLVLGETGTGKELVARTVHRESDRRDKPFVAINCAAIAPSLLESALFGHERGAFTGAAARAVGVFERANGGVLFLDEVGDLTMSAQVALLRAIETKRITRVGGTSEIPVDVQIVSATHCDLAGMVEEKTFRRDLYFRLNGVQLDLPPLRERTEEIEPLVQLFLAHARRDWGVRARAVTPLALEHLRRCAWPGNVRQLRYAIERAALLGGGDTIDVADLPRSVTGDVLAPDAGALLVRAVPVELALKQQLRQYERALIDEALRRAGGNRQAAAKLLRIPLRTLFRKMRAGNSVDPGEHGDDP